MGNENNPGNENNLENRINSNENKKDNNTTNKTIKDNNTSKNNKTTKDNKKISDNYDELKKEGVPYQKDLSNIDSKVINRIPEDINPKKKYINFTKGILKELKKEYKPVEELLYDNLYLIGVDKYKKDLKKIINEFDRELYVASESIEQFKRNLKGTASYRSIKDDENLEQFKRRIENIPERQRGIVFQRQYIEDMIKVCKKQTQFNIKLKKELETKINNKKNKNNNYKMEELNQELSLLDDKINDLKEEWDTQNKQYNIVFNKEKREKYNIKETSKTIRRVSTNKYHLSSTFQNIESFETFWNFYKSTSSLMNKNENIKGVVNVENEYSREMYDSMEQINSEGTYIEAEPLSERMEENKKSIPSIEELILETKRIRFA